MKKIALIGLNYDTNLGDPIICDSTKFLVNQIINEKNKTNKYELSSFDMSGRIDFEKMYNYQYSFFQKYIVRGINIGIRIISKLFWKNKKIDSFFQVANWYTGKEYFLVKNFYKEKLKNIDAIIFVGGGLIKYKYQGVNFYIQEVIKYAQKNNISVMINAAGVEGFDLNDFKCRMLKNALNRDCVKIITTRDDIRLLEEKYIDNKEKVLSQVADSAVWISNAYGIKRSEKSEVIGLGVVRANIFLDNNINVDEETMLKFWKSVIERLDKENKEWRIFTNGLKSDYDFAINLMKYINRENEIKNKIIKRPLNSRELVETISKFKGIIACRLHACIISYSLNIPVVGLVWNDKLKLFGECIKYPDRFVDYNNINCDFVLGKLEEAMLNNYDVSYKHKYKDTVKTYLEKYIDLIE